MSENLEAFVKSLPKAELHAHLNGSISDQTLKTLVEWKKRKNPHYADLHNDFSLKCNSNQTLKEMFSIFPFIHDLTDSNEAVHQLACDVINEFAYDNVKYLELRTAPKFNHANHMTLESYVETVIKAIHDTAPSRDIVVRLLLSIDRTRGLDIANQTLNLALHHFNTSQMVVGIDLSGDPTAEGVQYIDLIRNAKNSGLKNSLHIAEIPDTDKEIEQFLTLPPDRIGHGTYLHNCSQAIQEKISSLAIPLELCLTSNIKCGTVKSYEDHHLKIWCNKNPVILCTDDKGVFGTTLNQEYEMAKKWHYLTNENLTELAKNGFKFSFVDENMKSDLLKKYF